MQFFFQKRDKIEEHLKTLFVGCDSYIEDYVKNNEKGPFPDNVNTDFFQFCKEKKKKVIFELKIEIKEIRENKKQKIVFFFKIISFFIHSFLCCKRKPLI